MQRIATHVNGMYSWLSKIRSEIQTFNFGHLSSGLYIYASKDVRHMCLFFEAKRSPRAKMFGETQPHGCSPCKGLDTLHKTCH
jgi:hypothetical protein